VKLPRMLDIFCTFRSFS